MAMTKWIPTTNLMQLRRFGKLSEELGELSNVAARCIIQGIDEVDPGTGKVNRQRLLDELADVQAQIECTLMAFGLDLDYFQQRSSRKVEQMLEWEALFASDGVPAGVRAAPPSVASSNTERVVFKCDNPGGCRFPKQPCLASCSLTVNLAPTSGVLGTEAPSSADAILRELVEAHAEWDAKHWSKRSDPGAADRLLKARRAARDYINASGVPAVEPPKRWPLPIKELLAIYDQCKGDWCAIVREVEHRHGIGTDGVSASDGKDSCDHTPSESVTGKGGGVEGK